MDYIFWPVFLSVYILENKAATRESSTLKALERAFIKKFEAKTLKACNFDLQVRLALHRFLYPYPKDPIHL